MRKENVVGVCLSGLVNTGLVTITTTLMRKQLRKICKDMEVSCTKRVNQRLITLLTNKHHSKSPAQSDALIHVRPDSLRKKLQRMGLYYPDAKLDIHLRLHASTSTLSP